LLHVHGTASPNITLVDVTAKGIKAPMLALNGHHIQMTGEEERFESAIPLKTRH
jgi:hypothetical protein